MMEFIKYVSVAFTAVSIAFTSWLQYEKFRLDGEWQIDTCTEQTDFHNYQGLQLAWRVFLSDDPLSAPVVGDGEKIEDAFARHLVLCFREQSLTPEQLKKASQRHAVTLEIETAEVVAIEEPPGHRRGTEERFDRRLGGRLQQSIMQGVERRACPGHGRPVGDQAAHHHGVCGRLHRADEACAVDVRALRDTRQAIQIDHRAAPASTR